MPPQKPERPLVPREQLLAAVEARAAILLDLLEQQCLDYAMALRPERELTRELHEEAKEALFTAIEKRGLRGPPGGVQRVVRAWVKDPSGEVIQREGAKVLWSELPPGYDIGPGRG